VVYFVDRSLGRKKVIPGPEMGAIVVAAFAKMEAMCASHGKRPFIAKVSKGPDVRVIVAG
jgi:hypothetical protein